MVRVSGEKLRAIRMELDVEQRDAAEAAGRSKQWLNNVERRSAPMRADDFVALLCYYERVQDSRSLAVFSSWRDVCHSSEINP